MSNGSVAAVLEYWKAHDVRYLPGASKDELSQFEAKYGVKLPTDMREFYEATDGTRVPLYGQDHNSYDFWPLSEVAPDESHRWAMNFADYREMSWWYAADLVGSGGFGPGAVYLMGGETGEPLLVVHSFAEFLKLYIREDPRLWAINAAKYHESVLDKRGEACPVLERVS